MPPPTRDWLRQQKAQQKDALDRTPGKHSRGFHETRLDKGAIFGRGPLYAQNLLEAGTNTTRPGPKPDTGALAVATLPEWYIYWALTVRLKKQPFIDFSYRGETTFAQGQSGRTQLDFEMLDGSNIAIEVQGNFYHYEASTAKIVLDRVRDAELAPFWTVIDIDEDDALRDPEHYVREALEGRSHAYRYRNYFVRPFGGSQ